MGQTAALVSLVRPQNVLIAILGILAGGVGAFGRDANWGGLALAMLSASFGVAAGNALNDALDVNVDRRVHPDRPLPRGVMVPREAVAYSGIGFFIALTAAFLTNPLVLLLAISLLGNVLLYELAFKRRGLVGHFLVSYNVGSLFLVGALAAGSSPLMWTLDQYGWITDSLRIVVPLTMGLLALLLNMAREIYKAVEDAWGDSAERRTFAVVQGPERARKLAAAIVWTVVPLSLVPYLVGVFGQPYLWFLGPVLALFLYIPFEPQVGRAQRLCKLAMLVGFIPFLAVGFQ